MFAGLNEIHFPAHVGRAKCKYWRYGWKTDHGKHVLEGSGTAFPIPLTPFYGSCVTRLHTRACLCCEHTITIHHRAAHTPSFWPGWVRILSLASLRTWGELLFASGNLDNLNVACSGLSKTTVLCCCSTHPSRTQTASVPLISISSVR